MGQMLDLLVKQALLELLHNQGVIFKNTIHFVHLIAHSGESLLILLFYLLLDFLKAVKYSEQLFEIPLHDSFEVE